MGNTVFVDMETCLFVVLWTLVHGHKDLYSMVGKHDRYAGTIISGACDLLLIFYIHVPNFSKKKFFFERYVCNQNVENYHFCVFVSQKKKC